MRGFIDTADRLTKTINARKQQQYPVTPVPTQDPGHHTSNPGQEALEAVYQQHLNNPAFSVSSIPRPVLMLSDDALILGAQLLRR